MICRIRIFSSRKTWHWMNLKTSWTKHSEHIRSIIISAMTSGWTCQIRTARHSMTGCTGSGRISARNAVISVTISGSVHAMPMTSRLIGKLTVSQERRSMHRFRISSVQMKSDRCTLNCSLWTAM